MFGKKEEKVFPWLGLYAQKDGSRVLLNPANIRFIAQEKGGAAIGLSTTNGQSEIMPVRESMEEILEQLVKIFG